MQQRTPIYEDREKYIVGLKFKSPVHFGRYKDEDLARSGFWCGSDQLFSAMANAFNLFYGKTETEAFLAEFRTGAPPVILSSTFLMLEQTDTGAEPVYFLPKPCGLDLSAYFTDQKKAGKIAYLPHTVLELLANSKFDGSISEKYKPQGLFLVPKTCSEDLFVETECARVALDSMTAASMIYYITTVTYVESVGLYFMMDCRREWLAKIQTALRVLGDEGLGGERSYGMGSFTIANFRPSPSWSVDGDEALLLSAYYPSTQELRVMRTVAWEGRYRLREAGGYIYSGGDQGLRKKYLRVFAEGSVFGYKPVGQLLNVTPKGYNAHRVYRNCLAYTLPWNTAAQKGTG
ncbi:type III-A CRISPR-associated RAMP protein Csm4 [Methylomusa anaerophila]|uniref:CRISPR system Cms protein Csm4 n=1 Tax=Methylomusa anaerophila TaxID=1930071 RepID=A0A348AR46_9FIRM|nr:type III-A CRISPR-associated RAMP protein Csm4 [Methylomusa anaerophila]BBB93544.1 hypothetical protein MAMMFC1_04262 [Methylomusa anaerophila]